MNPPLRQRARVTLLHAAASSAAGLSLLASAGGCDWRKPLPHRPDAGPPVQLVDPQAKAAAGTPDRGAARSPGGAPQAPLYLVEEHEPNDDAEHAQPVAPGRGIRASLAPPTSMGAGKGADDYYLITAGPGSGPQLLNITTTTGPQIDLQLDVYSPPQPGGAGTRTPAPLWHIDERGRGEGERISGLSVKPGQALLVRVRGAVAPSPTPTGTTGVTPAPPPSLDYQLGVAQAAAPLGSELEPNDTYETASPAHGSELSGTLTGRGDEDFWVVGLADALYRPGRGSDGQSGETAAEKPPAGLKTDAILRVEARTPGNTPALRVWVEPASDGTAPGAAATGAVPFDKLRFIGDFLATKGGKELRLRNLPLPKGSARAFISIRGAGSPTGAAKEGGRIPNDSRYSLRVTVEPPLEGGEIEPNDDCELATPLLLTPHGGGATGSPGGSAADGQMAGFLWPGDVDCYRITTKAEGGTRPPTAGSPQQVTVKLALPGPGADCDATLEVVKAAGVDVLPTEKGAHAPLQLRARGDVHIRVLGRDRGCAQAPYQLTVSATSESPTPGNPPGAGVQQP